eukprot:m.407240 g.407240  ORF g.407240 m.407240 type:complete len:87 (+) comp21220_c0_seq6:292-552(+)
MKSCEDRNTSTHILLVNTKTVDKLLHSETEAFRVAVTTHDNVVSSSSTTGNQPGRTWLEMTNGETEWSCRIEIHHVEIQYGIKKEF